MTLTDTFTARRMCFTKRRFATDKEAKRMAEGCRIPARIYKCPVCGGRHLTRKEQS